MRIGKNIKLGDSEITVNDIATKINSIVRFTTIVNLDLNAGDTYQLNLPKNTLFIEPLVACGSSQYSGGQFVVPDAAFTYITNNDNNANEYRGIWIMCNCDALVSISAYHYCGAIIKGFRIWYIDI